LKGNNILYPLIILLFSLASCRVARSPVLSPKPDITAEDYINMYKDLAVAEMKRTGVPASITLAQGMVESDYGRSTLARTGNNHFGIKCHNNWTGPVIRKHDDRRNECFRKYSSAEQSFRDHSDFLRNGSRYNFLFALDPTDYKSWARGLKKAGYATNPDYANMLIRKIEENNLSCFDRNYTVSAKKPQANVPPAGKPSESRIEKAENPAAQAGTSTFGAVLARASRIMSNNGVRYIVVKDGDTLDRIAEEYGMLKWEIVRYNELPDNVALVPGQILYLEVKKDRVREGGEFHLAEKGETMYLISQKYGVKLKNLLALNRMSEGEEPATGQKIWLKNTKPLGQ